MSLVIYGAQGIALGTYEALQDIVPNRKVECFLVSEREGNAEYLAGLPVVELKDFVDRLSEEKKGSTKILIATPETVMPEIEKKLDENGLFCHTRMTSVRWSGLMGYHYIKNKSFMPLAALPVGFRRANLNLFMAKSHQDKPLQSDFFLPEWITPIQVGAALCKERVAVLIDCDGEGISEKNGNYSELTALYWIWKNQLGRHGTGGVGRYYGLVHYRRILDLDEEDMLRLIDNDIDVVLPYPMPYEPDIEAHHKRYLADKDWEALIAVLEELQPQYAVRLPDLLSQRYLYNYNIVLARENVLEEYCRWLFPILEKIEKQSIPKGCNRQDRYIGYMAETLETLYFMTNRNRWHIAHTGCRFLI